MGYSNYVVILEGAEIYHLGIVGANVYSYSIFNTNDAGWQLVRVVAVAEDGREQDLSAHDQDARHEPAVQRLSAFGSVGHC